MAAWSAVVTAIKTRADAILPGVRVVRGQDFSEDSSDVVCVALQDIDDEDWTSAGTFRQSMQTFGGAREELGSVNCVILARSGDGDSAAATDTAFGYLQAIQNDLKADNTLGITAYEYVVAELDSGDIRELQAADSGAETALPFVISYQIRI